MGQDADTDLLHEQYPFLPEAPRPSLFALYYARFSERFQIPTALGTTFSSLSLNICIFYEIPIFRSLYLMQATNFLPTAVFAY